MPSLAWLLLAVVAGVAAYATAWPAWQAYRARDAIDENTERYLAWRGRARRGPRPREGMTAEERRRVVIAAVLGVVAAVALLGFFIAG